LHEGSDEFLAMFPNTEPIGFELDVTGLSDGNIDKILEHEGIKKALEHEGVKKLLNFVGRF